MPSQTHPPVAVRPATADDIAFIAQLFLDLAWQRHPTGDGIDAGAIVQGTEASTLQQVRGEIPDSITYVIEAGGERAGRLRVVRSAGRIEIAGLQVSPACQNRGVGTAVIAALLAEGAATNRPVELEVEHDNPNARRLYERLGFTPFDETSDGSWMRGPG